jgi:hypothetical protein
MASFRGASKASLLCDCEEVSHLPELNLSMHLLNVSEKENADYCFFKQIISSKAIIDSSV